MSSPSPQMQRKSAADRVVEARKIQLTADNENKGLTKEQEEKIDSLIAESESLVHEAERREKIDDAVAAVEAVPARKTSPNGPGHVPGVYQLPTVPAEAEDPQEKRTHGFKTLGEFAQKVRMAMDPYIGVRDKRLDGYMGNGFMASVSGMSTKTGSEGGFMLPPAFNTTVWDGMNKAPDNLVSLTESYPVDGESLTLNANAETSRANGSRFGGVRASWLGEGDQKLSGKATFRQIRGEPHEIAAMCYVTDKLLNNASALEQYLNNAITRELIFMMNDALINGDGVNKPLGILNSACLVTVPKETGQAAATVKFENVVKMFARLHPECRINAKWFINIEVEPQLQQMTLGIGTAGVPTYLPPGGLSQTPYGTLFGRPVQPIEFCSALGTVGDIILADFSKYVTFTRGGIVSNSSIHLRFDYNETAFRWVTALDGQPWLSAPITPYKATSGNTLSSFVALATRA